MKVFHLVLIPLFGAEANAKAKQLQNVEDLDGVAFPGGKIRLAIRKQQETDVSNPRETVKRHTTFSLK
jgi:hypothetical protein